MIQIVQNLIHMTAFRQQRLFFLCVSFHVWPTSNKFDIRPNFLKSGGNTPRVVETADLDVHIQIKKRLCAFLQCCKGCLICQNGFTLNEHVYNGIKPIDDLFLVLVIYHSTATKGDQRPFAEMMLVRPIRFNSQLISMTLNSRF